MVKLKGEPPSSHSFAHLLNEQTFSRKNDFIPCSDAAGVIVALGSSVTRLTVGQRVAVNMALKHISGESSPEIIASMLGGGDVDGVLTQYRVFPEEVRQLLIFV